MDGVPKRSDEAAPEVAGSQQQTEAVSPGLSVIHSDLGDPGKDRINDQQAQVLEANEQLVLSSLRAQREAETSARLIEQISRSAERDALTDLPNRTVLLDRVVQAVANAKRHRARLALLFLDLNNFKNINDTFGHAVGDQVLKVAAQRLLASVRAVDTVSRHGGDEFLILLAEVSQASDAGQIAHKVIAALAAPCRLGDHILHLKASIGISVYPDDGEDVDTLIASADGAMYSAKRQGFGSFVFAQSEPTNEPGTAPIALEPLRPTLPLTHHELAQAGVLQARRPELLGDANERILLAALSTRQLKAAADQAQQRRIEFMAVLAYELRNSSTPIRTLTPLPGRVRADEPLLRQVQAVIERQVVHFSRLVDNLPDVERANTGKLRLKRQAVAMTGVFEEAVNICRHAMDIRLQYLGVHIPPGELAVLGDPVCLVQICCNLLDNASKYTQVGGEIELSVAVVDDVIVLTVSDSGIGITATGLPNVFEPFVQETHAIGFSGAGLGIGLTVARALVDAHGGNIVVSSAGTGLGSQFTVALPMIRTPAAA